MAKTTFGKTSIQFANEIEKNIFSEDYTEEIFDSRPKRSKPTQYPTGKPDHYSKDRRYVPITKKSDASKHGVRSAQGKGAKHKKKGSSTP